MTTDAIFKMSDEMSPAAIVWYNTVREAILEQWPGREDKVDSMFPNMERGILVLLRNKQEPPWISTDYFYWLVALNVFVKKFPDGDNPNMLEEPEHYGWPCSKRYVHHWFASGYAQNQQGGEYEVVPKDTIISTVELRGRLASTIHRQVVKDTEPLMWIIPAHRRQHILLGYPQVTHVELKKAQELLGPEFTLAVRRGGKSPTELILSVRPGVKESLGLTNRTRLAVEYIDNWYADVCEYECSLVAHIEAAMKKACRSPDKEPQQRYLAAKEALRRSALGSSMPAELENRAATMQREYLAQHASQKAGELLGLDEPLAVRIATLRRFVAEGHPDVIDIGRPVRARACYSHEMALADEWVRALTEDVDNGHKTLQAVLEEMQPFLRDGRPLALTSASERLICADRVLSPWARPDLKRQLDVRDAIMEWNLKLIHPLPQFSERPIGAARAPAPVRQPTTSNVTDALGGLSLGSKK